jgi:uncharacterized integral membrane protein
MPEGAGARSSTAHELTLSVELGAFVLLVLYIAIAALNQSDAELVLPFSKFDLGGVLEQFKEGVPGGAFVAPILKIQVPLSTFYVFAPIVIVLCTLTSCGGAILGMRRQPYYDFLLSGRRQ